MSFPRYPKYKDIGVEWMREVPEHWEARRFQRCVHVAEGQVDPEAPAFSELPLIAPNHVESGTGRLKEMESASDQGAESGKYYCKAGDVVYSKIRPALRKLCIAPKDCLCSADMYPLRAHSGLTNTFLFWSMLSEQFSAFAVLESQRVAMPKINRESLNEVTLALPPVGEQSQIASFLDCETAKIDALVAEQERLIELLKEKRQAVISHAVTKGLNPQAPLKPSGIEWLGEVPALWRLSKIKHLVRSIEQGWSPQCEGFPVESEDEWGVLKVGCVNGGTFNPFENKLLPQELEPLPDLTIATGDLLVSRANTRELVGSAAVAERDYPHLILCDKLYRLRIDPNACLPKFLGYYLGSMAVRGQIELDATGASASMVNIAQSVIIKLKIATPPVEEQRNIVATLDRLSEVSDSLATTAWHAIEILQERRSALISAAVTGQIDVRSLAGKQLA